MPTLINAPLHLLAILWASPYTLLSLFLGFIGICTGGHARIRGRVIEFYGGGVKWLLHRLPNGQFTLALTTPTAPDGQDADNDLGAECDSSENDGQLSEPTWRPQFSLRSILVLTFAVAVWLSFCRMVPHIAVFVLGIILAAGATYLLVRLKRKVLGCRLRRLDRRAFVVLWTLTLLSWAFFYVVSIGPVVAVAQKAGMDGEILKLIYRPVIWLHDYTPLAKPLEAYGDAWGWR